MSVSASTPGRASRRVSVSNSIRARCVSYLYTRVMESRVLYGNFSVTSINRSFVRPPSPVARRRSPAERAARQPSCPRRRSRGASRIARHARSHPSRVARARRPRSTTRSRDTKPSSALKFTRDWRRGRNFLAVPRRRTAAVRTSAWRRSTRRYRERFRCSMPGRWRSPSSSDSRSRERCSSSRVSTESTTFTPTCRTGIRSRSSARPSCEGGKSSS